MKYIILSIFSILLVIDPTKIAQVNKAKTEARKAYMDGDYKKAVEKYTYLTTSLEVEEDEVKLNLANSYFQVKDTANAISTYQSLISSPKSHIRSTAQQQLGILNHRQGKLEEALDHFKQAIKADANNIDAKYNYEMLKKKLEEEKKKQEQNKDNRSEDQKKKDQEKQDQQKKEQENKDQKDQAKDKEDQQKKDQQEKEQKEKEQKEKEEKEKKDQGKDQDQEQKEKAEKEKKENAQQLSKKLQEMKMSEEKAKMILEAMKNQEIQYLQQNKRKATKPRDKGKPDW